MSKKAEPQSHTNILYNSHGPVVVGNCLPARARCFWTSRQLHTNFAWNDATPVHFSFRLKYIRAFKVQCGPYAISTHTIYSLCADTEGGAGGGEEVWGGGTEVREEGDSVWGCGTGARPTLLTRSVNRAERFGKGRNALTHHERQRQHVKRWKDSNIRQITRCMMGQVVSEWTGYASITRVNGRHLGQQTVHEQGPTLKVHLFHVNT